MCLWVRQWEEENPCSPCSLSFMFLIKRRPEFSDFQGNNSAPLCLPNSQMRHISCNRGWGSCTQRRQHTPTALQPGWIQPLGDHPFSHMKQLRKAMAAFCPVPAFSFIIISLGLCERSRWVGMLFMSVSELQVLCLGVKIYIYKRRICVNETWYNSKQ